MFTSPKLMAVLSLSLGLVGRASAAGLSVPAQYATIQEAIDAASDGDTIVVGPGEYSDPLVIDRAVTIESGAFEQAVLAQRAVNPGPMITVDLPGGGVVPELRDFLIKGSGFESLIRLDSVGGGPGRGLILRDCVVQLCSVTAVQVRESQLTAVNCEFEFNGNFVGLARGGAIFAADSELNLVDCEFDNNDAELAGGAILARSCDPVTITSCLFKSNSLSGTGAGGGALRLNDCSNVRIVNSLFAANRAPSGAGAISVGGAVGSSVEVINCTITSNEEWSDNGGDGLKVDAGSSVTLINSIVRGNRGEDILSDGTVFAEYSAVPAEFAGVATTDQEPQFMNRYFQNFVLRENSPGVDAGRNDAVPFDVVADLNGTGRFLNDPEIPDTGVGSPTVDMGCYERVPFVDAVRYVRADAPPGGDGLSWATAYRELRDAMADTPAPGFTDLWVAEGTYRPDGGSWRSASFALQRLSRLYGGFAGDETSLDQRDWRKHPTILSGDIGVLGDSSDNSYRVVEFLNSVDGTVLDGFVIEGGNADGSISNSGGGIFHVAPSSPIIRNCVIRNNQATLGGGGAHHTARDRHPRYLNCRFIANQGGLVGGGIYQDEGMLTLEGCEFNGNSAERGGGLRVGDDAQAFLTQCTLAANQATTFGGGIQFDSGDGALITVQNSILWGNTANGSTDQVAQISGGVPTVHFSCVQGFDGTWGGAGNFSAVPGFADADGFNDIAGDDDDRLFLCPNSPCVDAGDDSVLPEQLGEDLQGNDRVQGLVDLGAYEHGAEELLLFANATSLPAGQILRLTTCGGLESSTMALVITRVDAIPLFEIIAFGGFDGEGRQAFDILVPAGLTGIELGLTTIGITRPAHVGGSREIAFLFE